MKISRRLVGAIALTAALAFPLGVVASHGFTDVPDSNTFHADIDALADSGVTTGCAAGKYCPKDFVTREQMAAFLNRLGALGPGKTPVVNATRLDGLDSSEFLRAGSIVTHQQGPWQETLTESVQIHAAASYTLIEVAGSGQAIVQLELRAPGTIDGQAYGLESVEVCYGDTFDVTITNTSASYGTVNGTTSILNDPTDRAMVNDACYTVNSIAVVDAPGAVSLFLILEYVDNTNAIIGRVTSTWAPVD